MKRGAWTAIGAVLFATGGFAVGAFGSAWRSFEDYAEPWRKMHVEHQGVHGKPSHTRVILENPKLAFQAIDLSTNAEGVPTSARVSLRDGQELTMTFDEEARPASLTGPDGAVARYAYEDDRTRVTFFSDDGTQVATKRLSVPAQLVARADLAPSGTRSGTRSALATIWDGAASALVGEAHAEEAADEEIAVVREIPLHVDLRLTGPDASKPGSSQLEASCAPLACVPSKRDLGAGASDVSISVTGKVKKSALAAAGEGDLEPFKAEAKAERKAAAKDLPEVARVVSALGLTAMACKSLSLASPLCVKEFRSDPGVAGGAISSLIEEVLPADTGIIDARSKELFLEDQARAKFDKDMHVEVCMSRDGFGRVCTNIDGRPFATSPMEKTSRAIELRPAVGGTIVGSFVMLQSDGGDCKFSPSPRTSGVLRLTFDEEKSTVSASLTTEERGTRANLGCSLGTANMSWQQNYSVSASQTFTKEQLHAGGNLPLHLTGSMNGSGNYSFSNCRSGGGGSAQCPPGKNDGYNYSIVFDGSVDPAKKIGSGTIIVNGAPLSTQGTWKIPGDPKP